MRLKPLVGLTVSLLFINGCSRGEAPAGQPSADTGSESETISAAPGEASAVPDGHNSRIALDWAGTYSGVLPCASCPGIETRITLDEDGTFERSLLYIDETPAPRTDSGTFTWNDAGGKITLEASDAEAQQYQVGENVLFQLDHSGERISGDLAGRYTLQKHLADPEIEGKLWKLVELRGNPVEAGQFTRDAEVTLRATDAVAAGNTSCNTFTGPYAIKSGQRISFGRNMAVTMMACPDMNFESGFLEVLRQVDNYSVGDDGSLSLNRARMAPLARFEADGEAGE